MITETNFIQAPRQAPAEDLRRKIESRTARVGIVGLGYVGLPLAVEFAEAGFEVTGIDLQAAKVDSINHGRSYIQDVSTENLTRLVDDRKIHATNNFSAVSTLDTINIC